VRVGVRIVCAENEKKETQCESRCHRGGPALVRRGEIFRVVMRTKRNGAIRGERKKNNASLTRGNLRETNRREMEHNVRKAAGSPNQTRWRRGGAIGRKPGDSIRSQKKYHINKKYRCSRYGHYTNLRVRTPNGSGKNEERDPDRGGSKKVEIAPKKKGLRLGHESLMSSQFDRAKLDRQGCKKNKAQFYSER